MQTINDSKDEVAKKWGFNSWEHLVKSSTKEATLQYMDEVAWLQAQNGDKGGVRPNSSGGRPLM